MKAILWFILCNFASWLCVAGAIALALADKNNWGWFLVFALFMIWAPVEPTEKEN